MCNRATAGVSSGVIGYKMRGVEHRSRRIGYLIFNVLPWFAVIPFTGTGASGKTQSDQESKHGRTVEGQA